MIPPAPRQDSAPVTHIGHCLDNTPLLAGLLSPSRFPTTTVLSLRMASQINQLHQNQINQLHQNQINQLHQKQINQLHQNPSLRVHFWQNPYKDMSHDHIYSERYFWKQIKNELDWAQPGGQESRDSTTVEKGDDKHWSHIVLKEWKGRTPRH